jgi:hypothetical protein
MKSSFPTHSNTVDLQVVVGAAASAVVAVASVVAIVVVVAFRAVAGADRRVMIAIHTINLVCCSTVFAATINKFVFVQNGVMECSGTFQIAIKSGDLSNSLALTKKWYFLQQKKNSQFRRGQRSSTEQENQKLQFI